MVNSDNKNVLRAIFAYAFILAFFFLNPSTRTAVSINLVFLLISLFVFSSKIYQNSVIGIKTSNFFSSLIFGALVGGGFYILTRFLPALSLGLPLLPNTISDQVKFIIVVIIAPFFEEVFFRGALMGFIKEFNPSKKSIAIANVVQALAFSLFHVGAYITGFYNLPNFTAGLSSIQANISTFTSAFSFGILAGYIVTRPKIKNLVATIALHLILNLIVFTALTVSFG